MQMKSIEKQLQQNAYPGRGIIIGKSANGKYAVTAYFIMGRSSNSVSPRLYQKIPRLERITHTPLAKTMPRV